MANLLESEEEEVCNEATTVPQSVTSIQDRNKQSVVRVQPDTLYNSRSLSNQVTSTVPPANKMTIVGASGAYTEEAEVQTSCALSKS